jgi:pimeloyl-ACP methyl ester carboxylesterase
MDAQGRGLQPRRPRHPHPLSPLPAASLVALASLLAGCTTLVAGRIVEPPTSQTRRAELAQALERAGTRLEFLERPGAPRIAHAVIEPGDHRLRYEYLADGGRWTWRLSYRVAAPAMPPRGTVVLLHGWSTELATSLPWALAYAERGWRAVLVDLRNHGRSGKAPSGFGAHEAQDVGALLDQLVAAGRAPAPRVLHGVSLGAVVALHVAATRADIAAVVAIEPYANAADAVRSGFVGVVNDATEWLVDDDTMDSAIARAGRKLDLDLTTLETRPVLARVVACTLLLQGQRDSVVPVDAGRTLEGATPRAQRLELPWDGHFSTVGRLDLLADPVAAWLDRATAAAVDCPPLVVYAWTPQDGLRSVLDSPWRWW